MQLDPAAAAAAAPRAQRRKRKDWRDSVSVDKMISLVQKAHRISIHPFGGFYCLGVHKTLARFKSMFPDICVRKKDLVNMIDESCSRIQANERLMQNLPLLPRNQRRRIHTYAVDTVEELGQPFLMHHINIADFIFILDSDLQNCFWVLVELTPPELVQVKYLYVSTISRLYPHDVQQVLADFNKRLILPPKSLILIDGNKKIDFIEFEKLQRRLQDTANWFLISHPWGIKLPVQALVERKVKLVKQFCKKNPQIQSCLDIELNINK